MMGSSGSFDEDDCGPESREGMELEVTVAPSRTALNREVDFILKGHSEVGV
jgi:hypothetical protein